MEHFPCKPNHGRLQFLATIRANLYKDDKRDTRRLDMARKEEDISKELLRI